MKDYPEDQKYTYEIESYTDDEILLVRLDLATGKKTRFAIHLWCPFCREGDSKNETGR